MFLLLVHQLPVRLVMRLLPFDKALFGILRKYTAASDDGAKAERIRTAAPASASFGTNRLKDSMSERVTIMRAP